MMNRGQLFGQPFMYIFYIIVAVLILFFGVKAIINLTDLSGDINTKLFYEDVEKKFNTVYTDSYESVVTLESIKVPNEMIEICFVDNSPLYIFDSSSITNNKLKIFIEEAHNSRDKDNVFILGSEPLKRKIDRLILDDSVLCDSLKDSKINIKLINLGQEIKAEAI